MPGFWIVKRDPRTDLGLRFEVQGELAARHRILQVGHGFLIRFSTGTTKYATPASRMSPCG